MITTENNSLLPVLYSLCSNMQNKQSLFCLPLQVVQYAIYNEKWFIIWSVYCWVVGITWLRCRAYGWLSGRSEYTAAPDGCKSDALGPQTLDSASPLTNKETERSQNVEKWLAEMEDRDVRGTQTKEPKYEVWMDETDTKTQAGMCPSLS